jgi:amidophosphoribosyltransferase
VAMLREAGAAEVHIRISSPPVAWPCFYGIDFATRAELIAGNLSIAEIEASIGADSLGYVSLDGLLAATTLPAGRLCRACFDGDYPVPFTSAAQGKHVLEAAAVTTARVTAAPVTTVPVITGPVTTGPVTGGDDH